jgi:hypothetical protein
MTDEGLVLDLSGHFWADCARRADLDRWVWEIFDYQGNVMAAGVATSREQAVAFVWAWDSVLAEADDHGDPSLDFDQMPVLTAGPLRTPADAAED